MELADMGTWPYQSPFIEGPASQRDQWTDAVVLALRDGGLERISMRSISLHLGCTPGAVFQSAGSKHELMFQVVRTFGYRYALWLKSASGTTWCSLPIEPDELHAVRVWRSFTDLGSSCARAGRPEIAGVVAEVNASEADLFAWHLRLGPSSLDRSALPAALACLRGLRNVMAAESAPLSLGAARVAAERLLPQLTTRIAS